MENYKEKYSIGLLTKINPDLGEGKKVKEKRQVGNRKKKIKKLVIFSYHQGKVDKASLRDLLMCNWFLEAAEVVFRGFNANLV